jgi:hypothetical protein
LIEGAPELAAHEEVGGLELHELPVECLRAIPVAAVEGDVHQRAERLLPIRGHGLNFERLFVASAGLRDISTLPEQASEGEEARGVGRFERERGFVGGHRLVRTPCEVVEPRERDRGRMGVGSGLLGPAFEVCDEDLQVPVPRSA